MSTPDDRSGSKKIGRSGLPASMKGVAAVTSMPKESEPKFRSVKLLPKKPFPVGLDWKKPSPFVPGKTGKLGRPGKLGSTTSAKSPPAALEEIDKTIFFKETSAGQTDLGDLGRVYRRDPTVQIRETNWHVNDTGLRPVPTYYPLEKSSRFVVGAKASEIAYKISECCRIMSVQASYDHDAATAALRTEEHVEVHLSLWRGTKPRFPDCIIVEAQRRKGDAVAYHKYCRNILDAADGEFDAGLFVANEKSERTYTKMAEKMLEEEKPRGDGVEHENSLLALEIAASLLKKDRMDARQLGMESLCLLTDPARTGMKTALMASRVVLTGSAQDETTDDEYVPEELGIREAILSLVQFGRLSEDGGFMDEAMESDDESDNKHPEEQEHNSLLHNLALAVMANALEVLENHGRKLASQNTTAASVADAFLDDSKEISSRDLLKTLLNVVGTAGKKPHDACLSAQCLRSLCQASKDARRRARDLSAKKVVSTALDVGRRTHVKLETETEKVLVVLGKPDDEDDEGGN